MIYEPCYFKCFVMPWVISGKSLCIAKKTKIKQRKMEGFLVSQDNRRVINLWYFIKNLAPMKAENLSKEITKLLPFCDAYLTDSFFKCCRNSSNYITL